MFDLQVSKAHSPWLSNALPLLSQTAPLLLIRLAFKSNPTAFPSLFSAVLASELLKLTTLFLINAHHEGFAPFITRLPNVVSDGVRHYRKTVVPGVFYTLQCVMQYVALSSIDCLTFTNAWQVQLLLTRILAVSPFAGLRKWHSEVILAVSVVNVWILRGTALWGVSESEDGPEGVVVEAVVGIAASLVSGLCAVFAERVAGDRAVEPTSAIFSSATASASASSSSVWITKLQTSFASIIVAAFGALLLESSFMPVDLTEGILSLPVLAIVASAFGGLVLGGCSDLTVTDPSFTTIGTVLLPLLAALASLVINDTPLTIATALQILILALTNGYLLKSLIIKAVTENRDYNPLRASETSTPSGSPPRVRNVDLVLGGEIINSQIGKPTTPTGMRRLVEGSIALTLIAITWRAHAASLYLSGHPSPTFSFVRPHTPTTTLLTSLPKFTISPLAEPREPGLPSYTHHPIHPARPQNQFFTPASLVADKPVITLMTVTHNPGRVIVDETARAILQGSLQSFVWVVVDDHSEGDGVEVLRELEALDPRIKVVRNTGRSGVAHARALALKQVQTPYQVFIDDDDLFELTALEQSLLLLSANPHLSLVGFYTILFGASRTQREVGFQSGSQQRGGNNIHIGAVHRHAAVGNCTFDPVFNGGGEDYDFWMCIANNGHWGVTIPEYSYWYRQWEKRDREWTMMGSNFDKAAELVRQRWPGVQQGAWPAHDPIPAVAFEPWWKGPGFGNILHTSPGMTAMVLLESYADTLATRRTLAIVSDLAQQGWRVTVAAFTTADDALRRHFYKYTHDVFVLPHFLRTAQYPGFIEYIAQSRHISTVLVAESPTGYGLLSALRLGSQVSVVDLVREVDEAGSYAAFTYSATHGRYIHLTLASSLSVRAKLEKRGRTRGTLRVSAWGMRNLTLETGGSATELREQAMKEGENVCLIGYSVSTAQSHLLRPTIAVLASHNITAKLVPLVGETMQRLVGMSDHSVRVENTDLARRAWVNASDVVLVLGEEGREAAVTALASGTPVVTTATSLPVPLTLGSARDSLLQTRATPAHIAKRIVDAGVCTHRRRVPSRTAQLALHQLRHTDVDSTPVPDVLAQAWRSTPVGEDTAAYWAVKAVIEAGRESVDILRGQRGLPMYQE
ncbi:uncharacterized protein EV422DRAFT_238185 [Fimicolochytrium jonesii]|uniref:uncharacterized protein n=1 Tax=Fimicolochytrium jonesii TaxID=1396493 RepID=UPI0022FF3EB8|nr:uncharacterized protein EV422DRAFT_238185 [Fimicolochytrium jonesii]KAI8824927.1 hypothetical protein EV422DRAFT_238185 [Fimicolochytrium jonesii]